MRNLLKDSLDGVENTNCIAQYCLLYFYNIIRLWKNLSIWWKGVGGFMRFTFHKKDVTKDLKLESQ